MKKSKALLSLKNVSKFYYNNGVVASGFSKVSLDLSLGEFVVITGESGSGKSTLLNVISGLDSYEEGEMYINGEETSHYSENDFENYRKTYIGNIFQNFNLVNSYTVYQNIELVLLLNGYHKKDIKSKIIELIKKVDLYKYRNTRVSKLSGGQKQRVAIARALAKDTPIIIADEPTGNLDVKSANSVIKLLAEIAQDKLVVVVTHNYEQVEKYATRKIEMHDGKVRQDINLKETATYETKIINYQDISFANQIYLSFRNAFNILPQFLLLFLVFFLVILAFLGEYSSFKALNFEESIKGYNYLFRDDDNTRIVVKKKDNMPFSEQELQELKELNYVNYLDRNELLIDSFFEFSNQNANYYFYVNVEDCNLLDRVEYGRLPQKDDEIVLKIQRDYYYGEDIEKLIGTKLNAFSTSSLLISETNYTIVGINVFDDYTDDNIVYLTSNEMKQLNTFMINTKTNNTLIFNHNNDKIAENINIIPSNKVKKGEIAIPSDNYCGEETCLNKNIKLTISNLYFNGTLNLKVTKMNNLETKDNKFLQFNNDTIAYGLDDIFYISNEDYNTLFNNGVYQISLFADNENNVSKLNDMLIKDGYKTLSVQDSKITDEGIFQILNIMRVIVIVILFAVLFFIAYFVIKLIQKSKNIYYATVRILGASKKVIKNIIINELIIIYNIAFFITIILMFLNKYQVIHMAIFNKMLFYLSFKEFILIYFILLLMSYLIAIRYSSKLFKNSAMKSYREVQ